MFGKMAIRNIPQAVVTALEMLATEHDRSMEAEARQALRAWVEPSLLKEERSVRRTEVAARLSRLLEQVNSVRRSGPIRPSHLAQAIGEEYAEAVEEWFIGRAEPSFSQLAAIANQLGAVVPWLQHGDEQMFPVTSFRLPENPTEAVRWLLNWDESSDAQVSAIHFVREISKAGSLAVIKEGGSGHCKTFITPCHVSDQIGAGGESMLAFLWVALELLYKLYTRFGANFMVDSYLLKPASFTALCEGNTHPKALLSESGKALWWEDVWDKSMYGGREYWPGWGALCASIGRSVESRPHLVEERQRIRDGENMLLKR